MNGITTGWKDIVVLIVLVFYAVVAVVGIRGGYLKWRDRNE